MKVSEERAKRSVGAVVSLSVAINLKSANILGMASIRFSGLNCSCFGHHNHADDCIDVCALLLSLLLSPKHMLSYIASKTNLITEICTKRKQERERERATMKVFILHTQAHTCLIACQIIKHGKVQNYGHSIESMRYWKWKRSIIDSNQNSKFENVYHRIRNTFPHRIVSLFLSISLCVCIY